MAKGPIIYLVSCDNAMEHSVAFATLAEARKFRSDLEYPDGTITRVQVAAAPIRQMLAAVYNRERFAEESIEVVPAYPPTLRATV